MLYWYLNFCKYIEINTAFELKVWYNIKEVYQIETEGWYEQISWKINFDISVIALATSVRPRANEEYLKQQNQSY